MSKRTLLVLAASSAFGSLPPGASAQSSNEGFMLGEAAKKEPVVVTTSSVEVGVGYNTVESFQFGEYSGLEEDGAFAVGNVDIHRRAAYDSDSTEFWEVHGTNLGLDSRAIRGTYGRQGSFKIFLELDQIPHNRLDDAETPYLGAESGNLTLPAGWVPAADAPDLPVLGVNLREVEVETQRTKYGGGFSFNLPRGLAVTGSYHREDKDGVETIAGIFGRNGGDPRAAILPKPVDYTTQTADLGLSYTGSRLQAQLTYNLSLFDNKEHSLTWENPYTAQGNWDASQDFNNGGLGRLALEPDNSAHHFSLAGTYLISPMTRVNAQFSYGRMLQDDDFLPYTINQNLTAADGVSRPVALPRNSLDGDVTTLHGNVALTLRPVPKGNARLEYTYDKRDNDTPRDIYLTIHNDTGNRAGGDQAAVDDEDARINRPYSRETHKVEVAGGYQVLPSTKVQLGYDFETIERDFTEVEDTDEHTGRIKILAAPVSFASGWVEYAYSTRDGSDYVTSEPFVASHTDEVLADLRANDPDELFENNAFLRKSYIADRRRHAVKGALTLIANDRVSFGLSGSFNDSDYHDTVIGLTDMRYASVTGDVSVMPTEQIALSAFVTAEWIKYEQTGYQRGNAAINPTTMLNPDLFWNVDTSDDGVTVGFDVEWMAIKDRLTFNADFVYSDTDTEIEFGSGAGIMPEPVPDLKTSWWSIGVRGEYKLKEHLAFRLGYRFEDYSTDDFALDGVGEPIPRVLTLGNSSPDYTSHVVWTSIVYRF